MKRSPITRRTPLLRGSGLKPVSRRRARENGMYSKMRRQFLSQHARCEFPGGCVQQATDVHHRRGRSGDAFLDSAHWSALCRPHHAWITEHPAAAVEMGISELRLGAA